MKTKKNYQIILKDPISFEKNKPGINKHQAISEAVLKYASFLDEMLALYPEQWYNFAAEIK